LISEWISHRFSTVAHTIKKIIENQSKYKDEIIAFLKNDMSSALKILREIRTKDESIQKDLEKFKARVKKMKAPSVNALFFMSKNSSEDYYAWWDVNTEEVIIHPYVKTR